VTHPLQRMGDSLGAMGGVGGVGGVGGAVGLGQRGSDVVGAGA